MSFFKIKLKKYKVKLNYDIYVVCEGLKVIYK